MNRFRVLVEPQLPRPERRWLIKGVIPKQGVGAIYSPSTVGKTFVALSMGAHIANGQEWFGHRVAAAPAVYVPFEGQGGIPDRVAAFSSHISRQLDPPEMEGNINMNVRPMTNMGFLLDPINLRNEADQQDLIDALHEHNWNGGILIIDTLAAAAPGLEENTSEVGEMIAVFNRLAYHLQCVVCFIHHPGKDESKGMRGWYGMTAGVDFIIKCERAKGKMEGRFILEKVKDAEDGRSFGYKLISVHIGYDEDGDEITSLVAVPSVPEERSARNEPDAQQDADDEAFIWEWVKNEVEAGNFPSIHSLQGQLNDMKEQRPITQKRIREAIHRLKARSALVTDAEKSPSGNAWLRAAEGSPGAGPPK